jgi:carbamoyl-phosphate synthase large subunit
MKNKNNILITAAGGSVYTSILPQILNLKYFNKCYLIDMDNTHMSKICDNKTIFFIKSPSGNDPEYKDFIRKLLKEKEINFCLPGADEELLCFVELYNELNNFKLCAAKNHNFVKKCLNKTETIKILNKYNFNTPKLIKFITLGYIHDEDIVFVKPNVGHGSKNTYKLTRHELLNYINCGIIKVADYCFQEYIKGIEYTVSVLNKIVVPKRIIKKKGITISAITEKNQLIEKTCIDIVNKLKPNGPINVQGFIRNDEFYIFEINPRISTTSILTYAAGINEIACGLGIEKEENQDPVKYGVEMHRFYEQLFVGNEEDKV